VEISATCGVKLFGYYEPSRAGLVQTSKVETLHVERTLSGSWYMSLGPVGRLQDDGRTTVPTHTGKSGCRAHLASKGDHAQQNNVAVPRDCFNDVLRPLGRS
jgi:hypothetical protein